MIRLGIALALLLAGSSQNQPVIEDCPHAVLTCEKSKTSDYEYTCSAAAQMPSEDDAPQYSWKVSAGRIVGDEKSPNLTINVSGVSSPSLLVTLTVRWPMETKESSASAKEVKETKIELR